MHVVILIYSLCTVDLYESAQSVKTKHKHFIVTNVMLAYSLN